jgi:uncharacterized protein YeaO (DUF488 family)
MMALEVFTSHISCDDPDRLDISVSSGDKAFAPKWPMVNGLRNGRLSWPDYRKQYTILMRESYRFHRVAWEQLLERRRVVLVCYCTDVARCHRLVLAEILVKLGARYLGENAWFGGRAWDDA